MLVNGSGRGFDVRQLNYNHLHYFWVVVTSGSIAKAAKSLHVTPQTISGQLRTLEERLGAALFRRDGRKLKLTETGETVHSYVDPMFGLAWKLGEALQKREPQRPAPLVVGVAAGVGTAIACRVLSPLLDFAPGTRLRCHEAPAQKLAAAVAGGDLDFALTDGTAAPARQADRVENHLVGQCGVTFFAAATHAERYRERFPASLGGAPLVLPPATSTLAKLLAQWFRVHGIAPAVIAEIESLDLACALCEPRGALLAAPTAIAHEVERKHRVTAVGDVPEIEQRFYIVCPDRAARREIVSAVIERARDRLRPTRRARAA